MDVALELVERHLMIISPVGFNPCFRGCRSGTLFGGVRGVGAEGFQSLFSWMSLWNAATKKNCKRWNTNFVSILVFVDVALELPYPHARVSMGYVSILVFVDVALEH